MVLVVKKPSANAGDVRDAGLIPESGGSPKEDTPRFLSGESHGQRSLAGYHCLGSFKLEREEDKIYEIICMLNK